MKKILFISPIILFPVIMLAQPPGIINRFKLLISNKKGEILLVKWKGNWEVPGAEYGDSSVIKPIGAFLKDLAMEFGVEIKERKLAGVFTYYMNDRQYPMIFSYYTAKADRDQLKPVHSIEEAKWFPVKECLQTIPYPNSTAIIGKIKASPKTIWGGAFRLYPAQDWKYQTIEDFYSLN